jgi:hypothetical protein
MVFSHPNHEFAVFGMVQRCRPHMIFLTDGGGQKRVTETRNSLRSIDLLDQLFFLNYPEQVLYDALVECNHAIFFEIINHIQALIAHLKPDAVFCDAIEFYNPLHDITLPLVTNTLNFLSSNIPVYEIPLVFQDNSNGEVYICQRFPQAEKVKKYQIELYPNEISYKLQMREQCYPSLVNQMGAVLNTLDADYLGYEEYGQARFPSKMPGKQYRLRYEWRGQLLQEQKQVIEIITMQNHFFPFLKSLGFDHMMS